MASQFGVLFYFVRECICVFPALSSELLFVLD